jgi:hypothetical protein
LGHVNELEPKAAAAMVYNLGLAHACCSQCHGHRSLMAVVVHPAAVLPWGSDPLLDITVDWRTLVQEPLIYGIGGEAHYPGC